MNLFKNKKMITETEIYKKLHKIIIKWLNKRDNNKNAIWTQPSDEDPSLPIYVMKMIQEINNQMPMPSFDKVKNLENFNMGHVDYVHKFALHCTELYLKIKNDLKNKNISPWDVVSSFTRKDNTTIVTYRNGAENIH